MRWNILLIQTLLDSLDITCCWPVVNISPIRRVEVRAINYKIPQISPLNQVSYLLLQLKAIFCIVIVILVELIVLVLISPEGVGLDLPRPLHKVLILNFHEYLGYRGVERR